MQYLAVKTKNLLVRKEGMFHYRGTTYSGLVDVENNALYDNPEDSFLKSLGMADAVEDGKIVPIQGEIVNWKDRLPWKPKLSDIFPIKPLQLGVRMVAHA